MPRHYKLKSMQRAKLISKILFYFTRGFAIIYFGIALYSAVCLLTGWSVADYEEGKYFHIFYPLTTRTLMNVDNNTPYILFEFLIPLILYGLFFLLASNVFRVFHRPRLFTRYGIKQLQNFYLANWILPVSAIILAWIFASVEDFAFALAVIHFILGIFVYFLSAIFKQGMNLQNEQDLFI